MTAPLSDQEIAELLADMHPQFRLGHAAARKEAADEIAQLRRQLDGARAECVDLAGSASVGDGNPMMTPAELVQTLTQLMDDRDAAILQRDKALAEVGRLREAFRVNALRGAFGADEVDAVIDAALGKDAADV